MSLPHADIDPDGLLEYSVVFTDRSLNHMSSRFVGVMQETLAILREAYGAHSVAIVQGAAEPGLRNCCQRAISTTTCWRRADCARAIRPDSWPDMAVMWQVLCRSGISTTPPNPANQRFTI